MITHFYSDPHFGHANIIRYCERPFADLGEMHRELIARYNATVGEDDFVLWLGDAFLMKAKDATALLAGLNGRKAIIVGNHDRSKARMAEVGFAFAADTLTLHMAGRRVLASHYPYAGSEGRGEKVDERYAERRPPRVKGQVLLHGHVHSKRRRDGAMIHVGVDAWDFAPVPFADVAALVAEV